MPCAIAVQVGWGSTGSNTLKVAGLDLTVDDVRQLRPSICLRLRTGTTWQQITMDPRGAVLAALFDPNLNCCPVSVYNHTVMWVCRGTETCWALWQHLFSHVLLACLLASYR